MRRTRQLVAAVLLALVAAACTPPSAEPQEASPQPPPTPSARSDAAPSPAPGRVAAGDHRLTIPLGGGVEGSYLLHAPPAVERRRRLPLVVALHGVPGSPEEMERATGLDRLADRHGFLVAYPASFVDAGDVRRLVDHLVADWRADPDRVHVAGFSVGGALTYTLATTLADRIASFAAVSGPTSGDLTVDPPTSLLAIDGERDDLAPTFRRADRAWAAGAGCGEARTARVHVGTRPAVRSSAACRGGTVHVVYRVARTGHAWPPGASRIVWAFFAAHPLR